MSLIKSPGGSDAPDAFGDATAWSTHGLSVHQSRDRNVGRGNNTITDDELDTVVSHAHKAFRSDWRQHPVPDRASIVASAARKLRSNAEEYAQYLTLEIGKLIAEARAEVSLAAGILDYYANLAVTYLKTVAVGAPGNTVETLPLSII